MRRNLTVLRITAIIIAAGLYIGSAAKRTNNVTVLYEDFIESFEDRASAHISDLNNNTFGVSQSNYSI